MFHWFLSSAFAEEALSTAAATAAPTTAPEPGYFQRMFEKFDEQPTWGWVLLAVLLMAGVAVFLTARGKERTVWTTRMLAMAALCIALSYVLGLIRLFRLPNGGSITPAATLPLMLFAYGYGVGPGLIAGTIYGILDFLIGGGTFLSVPQVLLDYILAYTAMGLAGVLRKHPNTVMGLTVGVVLASVARWVCAVAAGVLFWAEYTPEGMLPIVYSMTYNGSYMAINCIICVAVAAAVGPRLVKELRRVR